MKKSTGLLGFISVFVCMLLIVSACHRDKEVQTNPYERLSKADMKYQNIQIVNFTITPRGVQETGNPQEFLAESQQNCTQTLTDSKLFTDVRTVTSAERANSTMIIQAELTKLRIVGVGTRIWIGAWAGKSEMAVNVKLIDASTGQVIDEREITDNTNPTYGAWSYGASDRTMPLRVGNVIADYAINAARR
jgi:hypothetical protein